MAVTTARLVAGECTLEQFVEVGAEFGFLAIKTFSCLREYQLDELVVQSGETFVKREDIQAS